MFSDYENLNYFMPDTKILMADGAIKNIENIYIDDEVITHLGNKKKVKRVFEKNINTEILKLSIRNNISLFTTNESFFYSLKIDGSKYTSLTQRKLLSKNNANKNFEIVKANELNKYDLISMPIIKFDVKNEFTLEQARILGLFAAEGSFMKKYGRDQGVLFTFNINEKETLAKTAKNLLERSFKTVSVQMQERSQSGVCIITATGPGITDFFRINVGEYSEFKKLSPQLVFNESDDIKLSFLSGWLDGDGCVEKQNGQLIGVTISSSLASQVRVMLDSLKISSSFRFIPSSGTRIINPNYPPVKISDYYRIEICATEAEKIINISTRLQFLERGKSKKQNSFYENYHIFTIVGSEDIEYNGNVYNFEVEDDNSYIANFVSVCNVDYSNNKA